jgi:signal transduction histidine kinase
MALERCTFSLREVIFEALTSLAFGAAAKNLDVFLEIHPAVPDLVVGDGSRLGQVVKNLASVALPQKLYIFCIDRVGVNLSSP